MVDNEMKELLDRLHVFDKVYDITRIVDPAEKKVLTLQNNNMIDTEFNCYDFWEKNKLCENCISIRAYMDNETYVKLEYNEEEVYMVTAVPIKFSDRLVVVEFLKRTTNNMILDISNLGMNSEIYSLIVNLNNLALRDSLTGLYNRRYLNEKLPVDMIASNVNNNELSIIIVDIDFFKKVNDTYGHIIGDCVLKWFAGILNRKTKIEGQWVARFGGEEFLICIPGADLDTAVQYAEELRKKIEIEEAVCDHNKIKITASFGVYSLTKELDMLEFIDKADKKLYEAKHKGRNRVAF